MCFFLSFLLFGLMIGLSCTLSPSNEPILAEHTVRQSNANGKNCTPIDDDEEGIFARVIWLFTERINREINEDGAISFFFFFLGKNYITEIFSNYCGKNCERLARVPESSNGFPEVKWLSAYLNIVVHLSQFFKKTNLGNRGKFIIRKSPVKWKWEKWSVDFVHNVFISLFATVFLRRRIADSLPRIRYWHWNWFFSVCHSAKEIKITFSKCQFSGHMWIMNFLMP